VSSLSTINNLFKYSPFIENSCRQDPTLLQRLTQSKTVSSEVGVKYYEQQLQKRLAMVNNDQQLSKALRLFRRDEMVRIAIRDLAGWSDYHATVRELSALADTVVSETLSLLYRWQRDEEGTPKGEQSGRQQQMVVVAMGKLGARELNFSSDIDLIFAYPEDGETRGRRPWISNQEFFNHLAQRLIRAINNKTADGFVFRVDMRLRPFGESGSLVSSFDAMEDYYQLHGRSWERYAWIKGRTIAGDSTAGEQLLNLLRPFIYRRYIDYSAFESLREMKQMIAQQVRKKGMEDDIKLGPGGIREIEFIGQAFQLVHGGREPELQVRPILKVLPLLSRRGEITTEEEQSLTAAYIFLRNAEHRLQEYEDRQTQRLPSSGEQRALLAEAMGFAGWEEFLVHLDEHRNQVQQQFEKLFAAPDEDSSQAEQNSMQSAWAALEDGTVSQLLIEQLSKYFGEPEQIIDSLQQLRNSTTIQSMSREGTERLDRLMPLLIDAAARQDDPDHSLKRAIHLVESIGRRSVYFTLLSENQNSLEHLLLLLQKSEWIAEQLSKTPMLLDELMDSRNLFLPDDLQSLRDELALLGDRVDRQDLEQQMELLRHFQRRHMVKVAAVDVLDKLPIMEVSDALTWIAESVVEYCFQLSWEEMTRRWGKPRIRKESITDPGFLVIGYGKMGGIELGYGSDLDLVFLHTGQPEDPFSRKQQPVTRREFYIRLAQRMIHLISTRTMSGRLYEIDSRLRPNGASGLLVLDADGFLNYQQEDAWTWEHQALVRARVIFGGTKAREEFDAIRSTILSKQREESELQAEVKDMREKMRDSLGRCDKGEINLKQMKGGMVDIEFIVQYMVLRWASQYPSLMQWTDNIRLLEQLAEDSLITEDEAKILEENYRVYRRRAYHLSLQNQKAVVSEKEFVVERKQVTNIWKRLL